MGFRVVIPARYQSTRLPAKALRLIAGKTMICHVVERALESHAKQIVVATDDQRIVDAVAHLPITTCLTAREHKTGTDRIAEVIEKLSWSEQEIVVNLQGDEPLMPASLVNQVADDLEQHTDAKVTTLVMPIENKATLFDPNVVKVVLDQQGYALYFSRAPIPWHRDQYANSATENFENLPKHGDYLRHIGLYAYRAGFIQQFVTWSASLLEQVESLEQLRVLSHGDKIHVSLAKQPPGHGVDTEADLAKVAQILES